MIDLERILSQLTDLDWTPILLACLLGGMIGLEREVHGRPAGLRTHILVCVASTILILAGNNLSADEAQNVLGRANLVFDPNRLGAGILTGIGFIGAAAVIRTGDIVRGITTGACVWCVAGIGVVLGQREYGLAIASATLFLVVLVLMDRIVAFAPVIYRRLTLHGEGTSMTALSAELQRVLREEKVKVQDVSGTHVAGPGPFELDIHVRLRQHCQAAEILDRVLSLEGVVAAQWRGTEAKIRLPDRPASRARRAT